MIYFHESICFHENVHLSRVPRASQFSSEINEENKVKPALPIIFANQRGTDIILVISEREHRYRPLSAMRRLVAACCNQELPC